MPGVFALVKILCVCGDKLICVGAVGVDEVWVGFVCGGVIFLQWYRLLLLFF